MDCVRAWPREFTWATPVSMSSPLPGNDRVALPIAAVADEVAAAESRIGDHAVADAVATIENHVLAVAKATVLGDDTVALPVAAVDNHVFLSTGRSTGHPKSQSHCHRTENEPLHDKTPR